MKNIVSNLTVIILLTITMWFITYMDLSATTQVKVANFHRHILGCSSSSLACKQSVASLTGDNGKSKQKHRFREIIQAVPIRVFHEIITVKFKTFNIDEVSIFTEKSLVKEKLYNPFWNKKSKIKNAELPLIYQGEKDEDYQYKPTSCDHCFPSEFELDINNKNICQIYDKKKTKQIQLLILITSSGNNEAARNAIRKTWIGITRENRDTNVRYVFVLGRTNSLKINSKVYMESNRHRDIIRGTFIDSYRNLTYKTAVMLNWVNMFCGHAKYIMKTDQDVFVNVPNILNMTIKYPKMFKNTFVGACQTAGGPIRFHDSKYYIPEKKFPSDRYPGFCSGTGYVMSSEVIRSLLSVSPNTPFFPLEDVYLGLCAEKVNISVLFRSEFHPETSWSDRNICLYKGFKYITKHGVSPKNMFKIWNKNCSQNAQTFKKMSMDNKKPLNVFLKPPKKVFYTKGKT